MRASVSTSSGSRTTKTKGQGRAGQMCCTNVHKANLGSQLSIFDTGHSPEHAITRTAHLPTVTWTPPNDPHEQFYMGAHMTKMKGQGGDGKTSCTNMHKSKIRSQLRIFDTGSFSRARPHPKNSPKRVDTDALKRPARMILHGRLHDRTKGQGRAGKTSCTNVHKANLGSQLSIFDMGSFTRAHPHSNDLPK